MLYFLRHENEIVAMLNIVDDAIISMELSDKNSKYFPIGVENEAHLKKWIKNRYK